MNTSEKKQLVREAIVRAVPSVMDLKMGCVVYIPQYGNVRCINTGIAEVFVVMPGDLALTRKSIENHNGVIIGRPITLADVLVAIGKTKAVFGARLENGLLKMMVFGKDFTFPTDSCLWDPSQDFDHQSEAVWEFLYGLLCE